MERIDSRPSEAADRAIGAFTEFLELRARGEEPEFESWVARHPDCEEDLRELHAHWLEVGPVLDRLGFGLPLSELIEESLGPGVDPRVTLEPEDVADDSDAGPGGRAEEIRALTGHPGRYRVKERIARGGMGTVLRVWDDNLRRELAMKLVRQQRRGGTPVELDRATLERFLEEAEVTAQLDHPGIVPVHELGLDSASRPYFTMKLVQGRTLAEVFERVADRDPEWNPQRALGVLVRVCEAMSYAHSKGALHRDLKPSNVMVGPFGEVYVMDWGLVRVLGDEDRKDIRVRPAAGGGADPALLEGDELLEPPLLTMDGDVLGTPSYMPPEQARGELAAMGPPSDVYSVGAMLYHLLTGRRPYDEPGARQDQRAVLERVESGPPAPIQELAPRTPADLTAICARAMARDPAGRYASMEELAADLRAHLEGRVVRAYETGALAELRRWVRRNRGLAASILAALIVLGAGLVTALVLRAEAERQRAGVMRLSAFRELQALRDRADELWPPYPEHLAAYDDWLLDAAELVAGLHPSGGDAGHYARMSELEQRRSSWSEEDRWWHGQLAQLVEEIEAFANTKKGLIEGASLLHGWGITARRAWAERVVELTVDSPASRARWSAAREAIREHPDYAGLELAPQLGLLPIGPDPRSGLWEFVHLASGSEPARGADGTLELTDDSGLVFVLLPGGGFWMGAQKDDPLGQNYDPRADFHEGPVHWVELSPFFLSKFEMTQGQSYELTEENPSEFRPESYPVTLAHPVSQISWHQSFTTLDRMALTLPSEAQWEYAARGGTDTVWWTGDDFESLQGASRGSRDSPSKDGTWGARAWPDPVDALLPNPFGLHHVHGNQHEFCLDGYDADYYSRSPLVDPVNDPTDRKHLVLRGGSYTNASLERRSAWRYGVLVRDSRGTGGGVRPARSLQP